MKDKFQLGRNADGKWCCFFSAITYFYNSVGIDGLSVE